MMLWHSMFCLHEKHSPSLAPVVKPEVVGDETKLPAADFK